MLDRDPRTRYASKTARHDLKTVIRLLVDAYAPIERRQELQVPRDARIVVETPESVVEEYHLPIRDHGLKMQLRHEIGEPEQSIYFWFDG